MEIEIGIYRHRYGDRYRYKVPSMAPCLPGVTSMVPLVVFGIYWPYNKDSKLRAHSKGLWFCRQVPRAWEASGR